MTSGKKRNGQPVRDLQTMLRVIAEAEPSLPKLNPDGIFGNETKRAVMAFQQAHDLRVDGVVNETTWNAIADAYDEDYVNYIVQPSLCLPLQPMQVISPQEENCHICLVQALLHTMAQRFENLPDTEITGRYDQKTQQAVLLFKQLCGHEDSNELIDRCFFKELFCCYRCVTGNGQSD
ncbi:MAG: peptidoglycan-binding protein [Clostridia bacterium]|nr:peptidoglycan-binding protein [Clostridia bacterium]